ncbi:cyclophilin type peptidyl-prolyl cis-trans isomerase, putative [Bodo saltans]|uniref:Cyclophilin type peptidyl-prolyl cis-trans isomerase, putative n=1 Tax=Bodo saltans TaxID=75058 RepID=A0A0S4JYL6_BODSA|nr:cyclophilin type peptidyl-prolyl cis-trans isomerase, putative [Bodo saltans]|eukprot:CUG94240.1 cyclophilin type peptidyl-prolyl cis-trans isomerase, putative [Bodo saltans]
MSDSDDDDFGPALPMMEVHSDTTTHTVLDETPAEGSSSATNAKRPRDDSDASLFTTTDLPPPPLVALSCIEESSTPTTAQPHQREEVVPDLEESSTPTAAQPQHQREEVVPDLAIATRFERSYVHSSRITGVAHIAWTAGEMVLTLCQNDGVLYWWLKLPRSGLFLAKCSPLHYSSPTRGEDDDAVETHTNAETLLGSSTSSGRNLLLQSGSTQDPQVGRSAALVLDVANGYVRWVLPELLELGPRIALPTEVASLLLSSASSSTPVVCHLWQPPRHYSSNATFLIVAHPLEPKVTIVRVDVMSSSTSTVWTTVGSGTMHPLAYIATHEASGLLVVVDTKGIIDYILVDPEAAERDSALAISSLEGGGGNVWRLVRGTDEFNGGAAKTSTKKQHQQNASKKEVPRWVKYLTFPTRTKTNFFAAFREGQSPSGLSVDHDSFMTSSVSADGCSMVARVFSFASGKVISTTSGSSAQLAGAMFGGHGISGCRAELLLQQLQHPTVTSQKERSGTSGQMWCTVGERTGTCDAVYWREPLGQTASSTPSRTWHFTGPSQCELPLLPRFCVEGHRPPVSQQLRNTVAKSPLGSGLGPEAINTLLGASGAVNNSNHNQSRERLLICTSGSRLVVFSSERDLSVDDEESGRRREFRCDEIASSLGLRLLQRDDDEAVPNATPGSGGLVPATERLFATIVIGGHEACPLRFRLLPFAAPLAVRNFQLLADANFYNGLTFHRVIKEFMLQGGCPKGDGTGSKCLLPLQHVNVEGGFADEWISPSTTIDPTGELKDLGSLKAMTRKYLLCMANSGPNTNGSQFFVTTAATPWLAGHHTVFGVLSAETTGEESQMASLLHQLEAVEVDRSSTPVVPMMIASIAVTH